MHLGMCSVWFTKSTEQEVFGTFVMMLIYYESPWSQFKACMHYSIRCFGSCTVNWEYRIFVWGAPLCVFRCGLHLWCFNQERPVQADFPHWQQDGGRHRLLGVLWASGGERKQQAVENGPGQISLWSKRSGLLWKSMPRCWWVATTQGMERDQGLHGRVVPGKGCGGTGKQCLLRFNIQVYACVIVSRLTRRQHISRILQHNKAFIRHAHISGWWVPSPQDVDSVHSLFACFVLLGNFVSPLKNLFSLQHHEVCFKSHNKICLECAHLDTWYSIQVWATLVQYRLPTFTALRAMWTFRILWTSGFRLSGPIAWVCLLTAPWFKTNRRCYCIQTVDRLWGTGG